MELIPSGKAMVPWSIHLPSAALGKALSTLRPNTPDKHFLRAETVACSACHI